MEDHSEYNRRPFGGIMEDRSEYNGRPFGGIMQDGLGV